MNFKFIVAFQIVFQIYCKNSVFIIFKALVPDRIINFITGIQCVQKFWSDYLNLNFRPKNKLSKIGFLARPSGSFCWAILKN